MKIEIEVNAPGLEAALHRFADALENLSPGQLKPAQEVDEILPTATKDADAAADDEAAREAKEEKAAAAAAKRKAEAAQKAAEEAAAAAEAADDETPADEPSDAPAAAYTLEKVRQMVADYSTGSPAATTEVKEAFADLNVRKLSEVDPADYEELLGKLGLL